jgi:hypothetical protein
MTMTFEEKYNKLVKIFWDYNIPYDSLKKIIQHQFTSLDKYTHDLIIKRTLERLDWYDLLNILGKEKIKEILTSDIIKKIRNKELKARYERIRQILFNEAVPVSGWDPENIKRIKSSILSNRWYCIK